MPPAILRCCMYTMVWYSHANTSGRQHKTTIFSQARPRMISYGFYNSYRCIPGTRVFIFDDEKAVRSMIPGIRQIDCLACKVYIRITWPRLASFWPLWGSVVALWSSSRRDSSGASLVVHPPCSMHNRHQKSKDLSINNDKNTDATTGVSHVVVPGTSYVSMMLSYYTGNGKSSTATCEKCIVPFLFHSQLLISVSYTHLTLPTTPYV